MDFSIFVLYVLAHDVILLSEVPHQSALNVEADCKTNGAYQL